MKTIKPAFASLLLLLAVSLGFTSCKNSDDPKPAKTTESQMTLTLSGRTYTYTGDEFDISYNIFNDALTIVGKKADPQTYQGTSLDSSTVTIVLPNASKQAKSQLKVSESTPLTATMSGSLAIFSKTQTFEFSNKKGETEQTMSGTLKALDVLSGKIEMTSSGSWYNAAQESVPYTLTLSSPGISLSSF